jgi:uridine kinase
LSDTKSLISFEDAITIIAEHPDIKMIAVDGLPSSGKSTFAKKAAEKFGYGYLEIDNFFIDTSEWPHDIKPGFPFPFFRHADLTLVIQNLAATGLAQYFPFDWDAMKISKTPRIVQTTPPLIVEGIGLLNSEINDCFDLRFFIESDAASVLDTVLKRDGDFFIHEWRTMFIPSNEIYMATRPQAKADHIIAGRGLGFKI